jgi:hypothetical protein
MWCMARAGFQSACPMAGDFRASWLGRSAYRYRRRENRRQGLLSRGFRRLSTVGAGTVGDRDRQPLRISNHGHSRGHQRDGAFAALAIGPINRSRHSNGCRAQPGKFGRTPFEFARGGDRRQHCGHSRRARDMIRRSGEYREIRSG